MSFPDKQNPEASDTDARFSYVGTLSEPRCPQCHAALPLEPVQVLSGEQVDDYIVQILELSTLRPGKRRDQTEEEMP